MSLLILRRFWLTALTAAATLAAALPAFPADMEAAKAKAEPCAACHGENGISQMEGVPSLAGQPDHFTQWQLVYFRAGTRKNEMMQPLAAELKDADIRALGAYFASLAPPKPVDGDDQPGLSEQGKALAKQRNCASCHKDSYSGQQAIARVAGQREEYLAKALKDFRSDARTGSGVAAMASAAYGLKDDQIAALAHYLARVK